MKKRLSGASREERGFTLPEVMVVVAIMGLILGSLYGLFSASIRVFSFGNDKIESTENARVALERMEREIRAAYPQSGGTLLNTRNLKEIKFQNKPDSASPTTISYCLDSESENLKREEGSGTCGGTGSETLTALGPGGLLEFAYLDSNGDTVASGETNVSMVRIKLVVAEDGAWQDPEQELITAVDLRNKGS